MHTVKSATHLWVDHYIFSSWNSAHWGLTHDGKPMDVTFLIQLATFSMWKNSLKRKHLCSYLVFKELTLWLFLLKINSHIHYSTELWEKFLGPNHTDCEVKWTACHCSSGFPVCHFCLSLSSFQRRIEHYLVSRLSLTKPWKEEQRIRFFGFILEIQNNSVFVVMLKDRVHWELKILKKLQSKIFQV